MKNRYVGRTFIMPDQRTRELSVRRKLNAMPAVFSGKKILLVDDSIVRGTTMSQIVDMVRKAGAEKVMTQMLQLESDPLGHQLVAQRFLMQVVQTQKRREGTKRKTYAIGRYNGSLCTQTQPVVHWRI